MSTPIKPEQVAKEVARTRLCGCVVIDKPAKMTSHDVVARARRVLGERRIGHAGTLDPDATGVLVLGIGSATRLLSLVTGLGKSYVAEVVFGVATSSLDASGEVTQLYDMSLVTIDEAREAAKSLTGRILQVPPMVSALKVGGRRLHELARQGIEVERKAREVEIFRFEVTQFLGHAKAANGLSSPVMRIEVDCSSGTYVRTLAADLGVLLGGGAHLRSLRRISVGGFGQDSMVRLDELSKDQILPPSALVNHLATIEVDDAEALSLRQGKPIAHRGAMASESGPWAVFDPNQRLIGICVAKEGEMLKPEVILPD